MKYNLKTPMTKHHKITQIKLKFHFSKVLYTVKGAMGLLNKCNSVGEVRIYEKLC